MADTKTGHSVHEMSSMSMAEEASGYVRRMVERESRGRGDQENAMGRLESRYGLPFWSINNLRKGRAKTVDAGLFARIRAAYLDFCERQVAALQHEISIEKALGGNDSLEDLEREAARLAAKIAAARAARKGAMK